MRAALKLICIVCPVIAVLGGCDFVRALAGRPTSDQIALMRDSIRDAELVRASEREVAIADSLRAVHKADSTAAVEFLAASGIAIKTPEECRLVLGVDTDADFLVNIGAFKSPENAQRLHSVMSASGYPQTLVIPFRNGLQAVVIPVKGDAVDLKDVIGRVKAEKFCPADIWVLENPKE